VEKVYGVGAVEDEQTHLPEGRNSPGRNEQTHPPEGRNLPGRNEQTHPPEGRNSPGRNEQTHPPEGRNSPGRNEQTQFELPGGPRAQGHADKGPHIQPIHGHQQLQNDGGTVDGHAGGQGGRGGVSPDDGTGYGHVGGQGGRGGVSPVHEYEFYLQPPRTVDSPPGGSSSPGPNRQYDSAVSPRYHETGPNRQYDSAFSPRYHETGPNRQYDSAVSPRYHETGPNRQYKYTNGREAGPGIPSGQYTEWTAAGYVDYTGYEGRPGVFGTPNISQGGYTQPTSMQPTSASSRTLKGYGSMRAGYGPQKGIRVQIMVKRGGNHNLTHMFNR